MLNIDSLAIKSILHQLVMTAEYTLIGLEHDSINIAAGKRTGIYAVFFFFYCRRMWM